MLYYLPQFFISVSTFIQVLIRIGFPLEKQKRIMGETLERKPIRNLKGTGKKIIKKTGKDSLKNRERDGMNLKQN